MLKHAIDSHNGQRDHIPRAHTGEPLPLPPEPGDIDIIVAGFPWLASLVTPLVVFLTQTFEANRIVA